MFPLMRTIGGLLFGWLAARVLALFGRFSATPAGRQTTRRSFVRNATLGSSLALLGLIGGGFVRFFWPNKTGAFGSVLTVASANVPEKNGVPYKYAPGKFYIVNNDAGLMALYWKCPHLGCTVPWSDEGDVQFRCPCHGSIYDYNGVRLGGPAPRPMDLMGVSIDEATGDIKVDTKAISERGGYDPSQAVPYARS